MKSLLLSDLLTDVVAIRVEIYWQVRVFTLEPASETDYRKSVISS